MRFQNFYLALVCAAVSFFLLEVIFGGSGLISYNERTAVVQELEDNILELQQHNESLQAECDFLRDQPEYVLAYASRAGYTREDQGIIKTTADYSSTVFWEVGSIHYIPSVPASKSSLLGALACVIGILVYLFASLSRENLQGARVYNFSDNSYSTISNDEEQQNIGAHSVQPWIVRMSE
jgi:cell division protein FtsB